MPSKVPNDILNTSGDRLRRSQNRLRQMQRRFAKGGRVLKALRALAVKFEEALEMEDFKRSDEIGREMNRIKRGSSTKARHAMNRGDAAEDAFREE